jgi:hypothetical protein
MSLLIGWIVTHYYYFQASAVEIDRINEVLALEAAGKLFIHRNFA